MSDLYIVLGILISIFVQGGQSYEYCYNRYYYQTYECAYGCCGGYYDYDYGCCDAPTSTGSIVGGAIGGLFFIGIVVFFICCCTKKGFKRGGVNRTHVAPSNNVTVVTTTHQQQGYGQPMPMPGQAYPGPPPMQGYGMQPPSAPNYGPPGQYPPKY